MFWDVHTGSGKTMTNSKTYFGISHNLYGKKIGDVSDHLTIAINIHHTVAKCQCSTAETIKSRATDGR